VGRTLLSVAVDVDVAAAPPCPLRFLKQQGGNPHLAGNTLSIFRMIRSAHCTADATSDSVLGLGFVSYKSSAVFR